MALQRERDVDVDRVCALNYPIFTSISIPIPILILILIPT